MTSINHKKPTNTIQHAIELITKYNQSFESRDLRALRGIYVESGAFTYFDNHIACDSTSLEDHLKKLDEFFQSGHEIPGLETEVLSAYHHSNVACITAITRYKGKTEQPAVRLTLIAEQRDSKWRIRHLHFSNQPC